jgi:hypothetical protein
MHGREVTRIRSRRQLHTEKRLPVGLVREPMVFKAVYHLAYYCDRYYALTSVSENFQAKQSPLIQRALASNHW